VVLRVRRIAAQHAATTANIEPTSTTPGFQAHPVLYLVHHTLPYRPNTIRPACYVCTNKDAANYHGVTQPNPVGRPWRARGAQHW
jgi:hypothetical protein